MDLNKVNKFKVVNGNNLKHGVWIETDSVKRTEVVISYGETTWGFYKFRKW